MCLCTTPYAACVPTDRAKSLGKLLLYIMLILIVVMIIGFIGGYYTLSLFSLALIITGWCGVRDSNVFNIEQVLCVVFFAGYIWVYSVVDTILYLVNYTSLNIFVLISLFGGFIFYAFACYFAKLLYDELRNNYVQPPPDQMQGGFMNAFGGGAMANFGRNNNPPANNGQPASAQIESEPLRGQGHVLGRGDGNGREKKFQSFQGTPNSMQ